MSGRLLTAGNRRQWTLAAIVLAAFSFEATVLENRTIAGTTMPTVSAYSPAFRLAAAVAVVGVLTALAVTPRRGRLEVAVEAD